MNLSMVGAGALAIGTGVVAGLVVRPLVHDRVNVSPEEKQQRSSGNSQADGYAAVGPFVLGVFGGVGAGIGAGTLLSRGNVLGGLGAAAGAGALLGAVVGGIVGASQGDAKAQATYGNTIEQDVDAIFEQFDIDGSGALEIGDRPGKLPEFLTSSGHSERNLLLHADRDSNGDQVVTRDELLDLYRPFDTNGNGKLSSGESYELREQKSWNAPRD